MYNFEDIVGNKHVVKNLKTSVDTGKISHAYIINGDEGTGKKLLSKIFAKAILCEGNNSPCDKCASCHSFDNNNNPDVIYVKSDKKTIGVKEVRDQIVDIVDVKPYKYNYKIFIIENADKMSIAAQNAILKTLEEPPRYAVFILTASNIELFLPSILSRCVVVKLRAVNNEQIRDFLIKNKGIDENHAELYAEYSQGIIVNALKISSSSEFINMREDVIKWFTSIKNKSLSSVLLIADEMKIYKDNKEFLDIAYMWYRDILSYKKVKDSNFVIQKDKLSSIIQESEMYKEEEIIKALEAIMSAKIQLSQNGSFQVCMEVMLIKIKG